jgi:hypothetical protein
MSTEEYRIEIPIKRANIACAVRRPLFGVTLMLVQQMVVPAAWIVLGCSQM